MKLRFFGGGDKPASDRPHRPVTMYTTRFCGFCMRARRLLEEKGVAFEEIAVDGNRDLWQEMEDRTGRHTVPQIFIGDMHVGGCDDLYALEYAGELDDVLFTDVDEAPEAD